MPLFKLEGRMPAYVDEKGESVSLVATVQLAAYSEIAAIKAFHRLGYREIEGGWIDLSKAVFVKAEKIDDDNSEEENYP